MLKISKDDFIPKSNVSLILGFNSEPVKTYCKNLKAEGKLFNLTKGRKTLSVIVLKTGEAVLSGLTAETLSNRMTKKGYGAGNGEDE